MRKDILKAGKRFLVSYLKSKKVGNEEIHPWRNSWEFIVLHSLRVENYAQRILKRENRTISHNETIILRLACILHDIGRIHKREQHALLGRDIVYNWLKNTDIFDGDAIKLLLYLIEKHSDKKDGAKDYLLQVIRDADLLDEIGVISVFMCANRIDNTNPYFFNMLRERISDVELAFCDETLGMLNTEGARSILAEKKQFLSLFVCQLSDELSGTEMFSDFNITETIRNIGDVCDDNVRKNNLG